MSDRPPRTHWELAALLALPVYWVLLFVATHYPSVQIPTKIEYRDKVIHFTAFGLLALLYWSFVRARGPLGGRFVWVTGGVLIVYAAIDEYLQQFFGRHTDIMDYLANVAGISVALIVLELRRRRAVRAG